MKNARLEMLRRQRALGFDNLRNARQGAAVKRGAPAARVRSSTGQHLTP